MTEDRSLGEFEVVESDAPSNPADFDFTGWLAGFRPVRRSVKLYGRADLIGDAERLLADGDTDGAAAALDAGTVWVNCYNAFDNASPWGGFKQSGWGREKGPYGLDLFTQIKSVVINYT